MGMLSARLAWSKGLSGESAKDPRFAYLGYEGVSADGSPEHGIQVFAITGRRWKKVQTVASERPAFLAMHPNQKFLYAVNEIDSFRHLPAGSVEAYVVDPESGHLTLLNRQSLALSATSPRHMAITPDGRSLVVAVHGGGAYNVLPIAENGELGHVTGIMKEIGAGVDEHHQKAAHPQMVAFDSTGRVLGADLGADRLSVFTLADHQMTVHGRSSLRAGSGPRNIALHPEEQLLFVANGLESSVASYRYDAAEGKVLSRLDEVTTTTHGAKEKASVVMAMHPSGRFLFTSHRSLTPGEHGKDGLTVWRVNTATGSLKRIQVESEGLSGVHSIVASADGKALFLLSQKSGRVMRLKVDAASGRVSGLETVAQLPAPASMAMKLA